MQSLFAFFYKDVLKRFNASFVFEVSAFSPFSNADRFRVWFIPLLEIFRWRPQTKYDFQRGVSIVRINLM